ncbi:MAG: CPBP family intramembrane metalloprotease [Spirochaetales bacterium]|nr:CPBP family intramembrane metalloprotease [Spirochaetales bacterium]
MRVDGRRPAPRAIAACAVAFLVAAAATPARAQSADETELAWYLSSSGALQAATVFESFAYGEAWLPWALLGTAGAQTGVGLAFGTEDALPLAGAQLGLSLAFAANELAFGTNLATPLLFNAAHKLSMYATYSGYADIRMRSDDPDYAAGLGRSAFGELALAPFKPASYAPWPVWGYVASMGAFAAVSALGAAPGEAVWDTGSAFLGDAEFPVWAGVGLMLLLQVPNFVMTGVGEEALYRGTYYEELSTRLGEWPAKLLDASWFTFSHYPQQWDELMDLPFGQLLLKTALSFAQAFWFQYVYEWHGLEYAVAAHAASDVLVFFVDWLAQGGVPNGAGFSINERTMMIGLTFKL